MSEGLAIVSEIVMTRLNLTNRPRNNCDLLHYSEKVEEKRS